MLHSSYDGNIRFQVFCNEDEGEGVELTSEKVDFDGYVYGSELEFHEDWRGPVDLEWRDLELETVMLLTNQQIEDIKAGKGTDTKGMGIAINKSAQVAFEDEVQSAMYKYLGSYDNLVEN